MTIEQCYSAIESNYEEVIGHFAGNEMPLRNLRRSYR